MTRKCRRAKRRRCYSSMKYSAPINNACQAPSNIPYTQKRELTYIVRSLLYYACFVNLTVPSKMCFPYVLKAANLGAVSTPLITVCLNQIRLTHAQGSSCQMRWSDIRSHPPVFRRMGLQFPPELRPRPWCHRRTIRSPLSTWSVQLAQSRPRRSRRPATLPIQAYPQERA